MNFQPFPVDPSFGSPVMWKTRRQVTRSSCITGLYINHGAPYLFLNSCVQKTKKNPDVFFAYSFWICFIFTKENNKSLQETWNDMKRIFGKLVQFFCLNLSSLSCCPSWLRNARLTSTTSLADHAVRGPPYRPQSWWVHLKGYLCENSEIYKLKFSCSCSSGLGTSICKTERCFLFTAGHF